MYKNLNETINNFMISANYQKLLEILEGEEFRIIQSDLFDEIARIKDIVIKINDNELEKFDTLFFDYLAKTQQISIVIGFTFAFNLFQDLNALGGEINE